MITLLAIGSRGDVQPYIALGAAIKRAGHPVRIATFTEFQSLVEGPGLQFHKVKGDIHAVTSALKQDPSMIANNPLQMMRSFGKLKHYAAQVQGDLFDACEESEAIVYHPGAVIGHFAAQHFGIPGILATPYPMVPTRQYPSLIFYGKMNLGGNFNILTHKIFQQMMWRTGSMPVKQFWKQRFGKAPEGFENPYRHLEHSKCPILVSGSPSVFPSPENCPDHIHYTGYWFYDEDEQWEPSTELTAFLENGPKPIYIGFGSMGNPTEKAETTQIVVEALQRTNQRGILATGWSGMEQREDLPGSIFMLDAAPHSWLFPRMAAVVHHGGAGTSAAGFRAGVPCIIVPHGMDQFAWGIRAFELGVGANPIPRKNLNAGKLADAIQYVLSPERQTKAQEFGAVIQSENGADQAAQIILQSLR